VTASPGLLTSTWPGPFASEARCAYERARNAGISAARSLVLGCIASFKQGWVFRRTLAKHTGVSVRTVQRAITQGKNEGLLGTARAKANEIPPGLTQPVKCGWSHRWIVGWGQAVEMAKAAVERARLKRMTRAVCQPSSGVPRKKPARTWTADEIDAELARRAPPERIDKPPP
jgi:RNase P protein component